MIISQGYPLWVVHTPSDGGGITTDLVIGWQFPGDVAHEGAPPHPIVAWRGLLDPDDVFAYEASKADAEARLGSSSSEDPPAQR